MNREIGKTFQAFVLEGRIPFPFETPLEDVQQALGTSTTYPMDQKYGSYAIYADGVELLFDDGRLCLVQYEIARLGEVQLGADLITPDTSYEEFKGYVIAAGLLYTEAERDGQVVWTTAQGVKLYFEENRFVTALQSNME